MKIFILILVLLLSNLHAFKINKHRESERNLYMLKTIKMVHKLPINDNRKFLFLLKDRTAKLIQKRTPTNQNIWSRLYFTVDIIAKFSNNIENKKLYEQLSNYLIKVPHSSKSIQERHKEYKDINDKIKSLMNTNDNSFINSQVPRIEYTAEIIYLILQAAEKYAESEVSKR